MKLYHYTCIEHLHGILKDGEIKTTRSNLKEIVAPCIVNGIVTDPTDNYKPVVWFSSELDFDSAIKNGLDGSALDKTEVAIQIDTSGPQLFFKWDEWAIRNGIDKEWFGALKKTAPQWSYFYVTEHPVKITDNNARIIFRPDIAQRLAQGESIKGIHI